ncbi:MAG TPA: hypothetical protein ENJ82_14420 [Bacteroidetes bacterium]|nr:hypothetical protein [Bacteroidota bacterium]
MKRLLSISLPLLVLSVVLLSSCGDAKVQPIEDTKWVIQSFWTAQGLTKITVTFNEDGSMTYSDDSSGTYTASWTESNGSLTFNVNAPGRSPVYRATWDNRKIEGTAIDQSGDTAILTGDEI